MRHISQTGVISSEHELPESIKTVIAEIVSRDDLAKIAYVSPNHPELGLSLHFSNGSRIEIDADEIWPQPK